MPNWKWNLLIFRQTINGMRRNEDATKNKTLVPKIEEKNYQRNKKLCRKTLSDIIAKITFYHFLGSFYHIHKSLVVADAMANYYWLCNTDYRSASVILIMKAVEIFIIIYVTANGH